ncbi:MAG: glycosyl hydrolase family 28-related protein, partial [Planctomycetota bacterium]
MVDPAAAAEDAIKAVTLDQVITLPVEPGHQERVIWVGADGEQVANRGSTGVPSPPTWETRVGAPFIYDPVTRRARANMRSVRLESFNTVLSFEVAEPSELPGVTIQAFVQLESMPQRDCSLLELRDDSGARVAIGLRRLHHHRQTYWAGSVATNGDANSQRWNMGHYVTPARVRGGNNDPWHHVAVVYDAAQKTVTTYLDHWLAKSVRLEQPLRFEQATLSIGQSEEQKRDQQLGRLEGWIDDVRISPIPLSPAEMLRGVAVPMRDIDFRSPSTMLPSKSGYVDVRAGFGAVGDGVIDDSDAFQRAFDALCNKQVAGFRTLYIPPGRYRITRRLHCNRFIRVIGGGRKQTILRLDDRCDGFDDPKTPQPIIRASSTPGDPGSNRAVNGSSIGIYFSDLTLHTGAENAGAKAIEYHSNNHGSVERVDLVSGDGQGVVGLDLTHKTNGPALIKHVNIRGFDRAIHLRYAEYSMTLEHVMLVGQNVVGILNESNVMAIRDLRSENMVPAIESKGGGSMLTLLDSTLVGGSGDQDAILAEGALYVRNTRIDGYRHSIRKRVYQWNGWKEEPPYQWAEPLTIDGNITEWWRDHTTAPRGGGKRGMLKLPIRETPVPPALRDDQWAVVTDYHALVQDGDWTAAIQAAIDSGKPGVLCPMGQRYRVDGTVFLRANVRCIEGMKTAWVREGVTGGKKHEVAATMANESPMVVVDLQDAKRTLDVSHLDWRGRVVHRGAATLVLRHSNPMVYQTQRGVGDLFLEGVQSQGWDFKFPQNVWCRQWNPEAHGPGPVIRARGATIWSLGFKTEYESSKLWARDGSRIEILGGFIYPVKKGIPNDRPVFRTIDSDLTGIWGMSVYVANHKLQVEDTRDGNRIETTTDDADWAKGRMRMDLFTNRIEADTVNEI